MSFAVCSASIALPIAHRRTGRECNRPLRAGSGVRQVAPATGAYDGRFQVMLTRYDIEAILPLRSGATHRNGA